MTHPKKLLSTASILALALMLGACGSDSNSTVSSEAPPPAPAPADPYATAAGLTALSGGVETPGSALMKATEAAAKITPAWSNGDSSAAMMSAQAVLDAGTELEDAKSGAEKVLEDLPDTPENAAERAVLEKAITAAEEVLAGVLKTEIERVTGTNPDEPETAEDRGKDVAEAVLAAFDSGFYSGNNRAGRVVIGSERPRSFDASNRQTAVTGMTSSAGQTFGEIFSSDVTDHPLGAEGALVPTISIAGGDMEYGIDPAETATKFPLGGKIENSWFGSTDMDHGIGGTFHCVGAGCEIEDGKLLGGWVFTPGEATYHYVAMEDGDGYTEVKNVWYGHWLEERNAVVRIRASAYLDGTGATQAQISNWGTIAGEDASATYSGNAVGRSVHQEFDTDGVVAATHSGSFAADVSLTATFGDSPMLEGKVSGFSAVDNPKAVDTGWEVTLEKTPVEIGFRPQASGAAKGKGSDVDGLWEAYSYTDEDDRTRRPDGIYGGFDTDFGDGQAAGAFATRKDN